MNITNLGKENITKLYDLHLISDIKSLYDLKLNDLKNVSGFSGKLGENIFNAIQSSKGCECWQLISALNIPQFAESNSKSICKKFGINILDLKLDDLTTADDIGYDKADYFHRFMTLNKEYVKDLLNIIKPKVEKIEEVKQNPFKDKTIVLTGTMSVSRGIIKKELETLGAKVAGSVSKKTDYLIYGEDAGSKYDKAVTLGVTALTEDEYRDLV